MQPKPLLIVTTRLPPHVCGVGTFSWKLDQHWPGDTSPHHFLVVEAGPGSECDRMTEFGRDWTALDRSLDQADSGNVLVHYAGHGYQRFGCPVRLSKALHRWKRKFPQSHLTIFFHEVPGSPSLTSKRYLFDLCSRRIAGKLANLADLAVTNTKEHARVLEALSRHRNVRWLPVPANVEPAGDTEQDRIRTEFVIFGLPFGRWRTLQTFDEHIRSWQRNGTLTHLHLVGPSDRKFDLRSERLLESYSNPAVVIRHGQLAPAEVSRILSRARFAFTIANDDNWSKSGSLMAFLAHGCVVIANCESKVDGLSSSVRPGEVGSLSEVELDTKAAEARQWYEQHADWDSLGRRISDLVCHAPPPP